MKKYVKLRYEPATNRADLAEKVRDATRAESRNDFVEMLSFSKNTGVVMTGVLTDEAEPDKVCFLGCRLVTVISVVLHVGQQTARSPAFSTSSILYDSCTVPCGWCLSLQVAAGVLDPP